MSDNNNRLAQRLLSEVEKTNHRALELRRLDESSELLIPLVVMGKTNDRIEFEKALAPLQVRFWMPEKGWGKNPTVQDYIDFWVWYRSEIEAGIKAVKSRGHPKTSLIIILDGRLL